MGGFEDKVRGVLSDTMNLPGDFLSMIPQYVAQNPVPLARTPGTRITSGWRTSNVTSAGTTFGTGTDVLASPLTFTADGRTDYILRVSAPGWSNSATAQNWLRVNLDGADVGIMAFLQVGAAIPVPLSAAGLIIKPSAGSHTVNARLQVVSASTATITGGAGVAGDNSPILVILEVA